MTAIAVDMMPIILPIITCISCKLQRSTIKLEWKDLNHIHQKLAICDDCAVTLEKDLKSARKAK